jgi:F-type H+-transporting ATPase subunit c
MNLELLDGLLNGLRALVNTTDASNYGLRFVGAGLAVLTGGFSGLGEGAICYHAVDGMSRNPEMYSKLRTAMILGCALDETTGIYGLVIAILCLVLD